MSCACYAAVVRMRVPGLAAGRCAWVLAGVAVGAAVLVLARQWTFGVGLSGDWAAYLGTARNLLAGKGFLSFNGEPYLYWPPLYPLLLAAAAWAASSDPFEVAGPVNAVALGLAVFVAGQLLRRHVAPAWLVVSGCAALAVAPSLGDVAGQAMSEAVFILGLMAALALACRYLEAIARGDHRMLLGLAAATAAALVALTRYIGVCVVLVVAPLLLLVGNAPLAMRVWRAFVYVAIALAPVGLWLLRTKDGRQSAAPAGLIEGAIERWRPSELTLAEAIWGYCAEVANWVLLDTLNTWLWRTSRRGAVPVSLDTWEGWLLVAGTVLTGACLLALAISVAAAAWRRRGDRRPIMLAYCVFGGFALAYLAALAAAQMAVHLVPLGGRYALPAFPPLTIAVVLGGEMLRRSWAGGVVRRVGMRFRLTGTRSQGMRRTVVLLSLAWLGGGLLVSAKRIFTANTDAPSLGLARPEWRASATLDYIRRELGQVRFHTNNARAVFAHTAHRNHGALERDLEPAKAQIRRLPEGARVVIMCTYGYSYTDAELREWGWLAPVVELSDGVVFQVARNPAAGAPAPEPARASNAGATEWCW